MVGAGKGVEVGSDVAVGTSVDVSVGGITTVISKVFAPLLLFSPPQPSLTSLLASITTETVCQPTVARALVIVDSREAALAEAGDLIQPIQRGLIGPEHVHAELGDLVLGRKSGRASPDQITLFKAVGVAVQDAVAARLALERAGQLGLGQQVPW